MLNVKSESTAYKVITNDDIQPKLLASSIGQSSVEITLPKAIKDYRVLILSMEYKFNSDASSESPIASNMCFPSLMNLSTSSTNRNRRFLRVGWPEYNANNKTVMYWEGNCEYKGENELTLNALSNGSAGTSLKLFLYGIE